MANITNHYESPLSIGGVEIRPGATARVESWGKIKDAGVYPAWLRAGVISVEDADAPAAASVEDDFPAPEPEADEPEDNDDRDQIIADLEELGFKVDKRRSTFALKAELDAAIEGKG
ncbi:hypothetical protein CSC94_12705 [Zhengella mangrovi]|uniref:Uncharacterized protein n=1 Tax=Zhengella mangrovi TaxID=1982044 RepID=A0A2G1QLZ1_9HYPH|nr:hypothetical protein [Zhengella mangrovi]PHP66543.1 hypothetical protein CSC94_12705 [Zhengella mangrovi]